MDFHLLTTFLLTGFLLQTTFSDVTTPHVCKDNGKCYTVIVDQQVTWEQAEEYCEKNVPNGRLASVHNAFDNSIIAGWLAFLSTDPWIGAFRVGSLPFSWTDGSDFDYTNWTPGQPTEHCAQVCRSTTSAGNLCQQGKWTTTDCSNQAQLVCEYGNLNETTTTSARPPTTTRPLVPSCQDPWRYFNATQACYRTLFNAITWYDAEATCRDNGGHLTSIHSTDENNFIGDLTSEHIVDNDYTHQTWIGMQDLKYNRQWSWSDGSATDVFYWAPGEPNNGWAHNEYCVELYSDYTDANTKYHWNDFACDYSMRAFVCKRNATWS